VYTAKETSTVDWLSGGRVDVGVGVGWCREEFDALGVPWPERGRRTDEYLAVLRALWCEDPSSYAGAFYTLPECRMHPKPLQRPHPPIHVGGESDAALRRVAAGAQGWHTFDRAPEDLTQPLAALDRLLEEHGRSRRQLTVTVCPYFKGVGPDTVARYAEAGADAVALLVLPATADDVAERFDALQPCIERAQRC
jgi:alkanesulfonate monooxygenase SsuD/methylene tetrahydromethanopterin reductase-like flavin-dependent oxidoreductase (luciferase family)